VSSSRQAAAQVARHGDSSSVPAGKTHDGPLADPFCLLKRPPTNQPAIGGIDASVMEYIILFFGRQDCGTGGIREPPP
jgi:hypothetical protein